MFNKFNAKVATTFRIHSRSSLALKTNLVESYDLRNNLNAMPICLHDPKRVGCGNSSSSGNRWPADSAMVIKTPNTTRMTPLDMITEGVFVGH